LEELVRRGARDILQRAIEAEVEVLLKELAGASLIDGRRAVVCNGHLPAREILTTVSANPPNPGSTSCAISRSGA
jgi:putative transposase